MIFALGICSAMMYLFIIAFVIGCILALAIGLIFIVLILEWLVKLHKDKKGKM